MAELHTTPVEPTESATDSLETSDVLLLSEQDGEREWPVMVSEPLSNGTTSVQAINQRNLDTWHKALRPEEFDDLVPYDEDTLGALTEPHTVVRDLHNEADVGSAEPNLATYGDSFVLSPAGLDHSDYEDIVSVDVAHLEVN
jgi:hypothetical protein